MSSARIRAGRVFSAFMIRSWRVVRHPRLLIKPVATKGAGLAITLSDYAAGRRMSGSSAGGALACYNCTLRPRATRRTKKLEKCGTDHDTISVPTAYRLQVTTRAALAF